MESKKDYVGTEKVRFLVVRDEWYTTQLKAKDQVTSSSLKRSITHRDEEGEVIEIDGDVTRPSAVKQTHHTLADCHGQIDEETDCGGMCGSKQCLEKV
jgi:hypothetical protein